LVPLPAGYAKQASIAKNHGLRYAALTQALRALLIAFSDKPCDPAPVSGLGSWPQGFGDSRKSTHVRPTRSQATLFQYRAFVLQQSKKKKGWQHLMAAFMYSSA
jgi:hypothetical protein